MNLIGGENVENVEGNMENNIVKVYLDHGYYKHVAWYWLEYDLNNKTIYSVLLSFRDAHMRCYLVIIIISPSPSPPPPPPPPHTKDGYMSVLVGCWGRGGGAVEERVIVTK